MALRLSSGPLLAAAFARAANIYWLNVYPSLRRELRRWRNHAEAIPDPVLRRIALTAQREKIGNIEGAVAFAVIANGPTRFDAMRAMACFETTFDYLDCLCEMPVCDPVANGRQLNQALITAVEPASRHVDYYAFHGHSADNNYLRKLVDACREAFHSLPAYKTVRGAVQRASARIAAYQTFNHGDAWGSYRLFERWGVTEANAYKRLHPSSTLRWWEIAASAGSSLVIFSLIAAAANPMTKVSDALAIERAYYPWIGSVNSLLDSVVDQKEDVAPGQHRLLDYYDSPAETIERLTVIVSEASRRAIQLETRNIHSLILAAMVSFYLSAPEMHTAELGAMSEALRATMGPFDMPTRLVMQARRLAGRLGNATTGNATTRNVI